MQITRQLLMLDNSNKHYCHEKLSSENRDIYKSIWVNTSNLYETDYYLCNNEENDGDSNLYELESIELAVDPLDVLYPDGFYNACDDTKYDPVFNIFIYSIKGNILFLLFNAMIYLLIIYFSLKSKDTI